MFVYTFYLNFFKDMLVFIHRKKPCKSQETSLYDFSHCTLNNFEDYNMCCGSEDANIFIALNEKRNLYVSMAWRYFCDSSLVTLYLLFINIKHSLSNNVNYR